MFRIETDGPTLPLSGALYGAGEARCAADPYAPAAEKRYAGPALGVVISGAVDYRSQTGRAIAVPGSIVFANAGEHFSCRHLQAGGNRRAVLALDPLTLSEVADDCGVGEPRFAAAAMPPSRRSAALYGAVRRAAAGGLPDEAVIGLMTWALRAGREPERAAVSGADRARVLDVARHLDDAYAEPFTLQGMAALAQLSRYHFLRVFRAVVGESPHQYLIAARLRAAADRLIDTRQPVTAIALGVGFNDISHFNATFRRSFGLSPTELRRAA
jgi:AraC-like DNA-binding protein